MNWKPILQFIFYDPIRKIFAVVFAFGMWFFVALGSEYNYTKEIRVQYTNIPDSLIIVDSIPHIRVQFSGRGGPLLSTWAAPPRALCNLTDAQIGENIINASDLIVTVGLVGISISHTVPSIRVVVDQKITDTVDVAVPLKGALKKGYAISNILVRDTVMVTGPYEQLLGLKAIETETLNINNVQLPFTKTLRIADQPKHLIFSRNEVDIVVSVDTAVERLFTNIPLTLIFTPEQRVSSEKVSLDTLIVWGSKSKVDLLTKEDITVKISLTQIPAGEYSYPATILLPDYVKPVYSHPQRFKIKIY